MDTVKAIINLKEGVLELEGPREFVEKYLELYRPDASKWQGDILKKDEVKPNEKATPKRTRIGKPKTGPSCRGRIRTLIDEGYFKEPRTSTEVINWLKEQKAATYGYGPVTAALSTLIKSNDLRRFKQGKEPYKYCNP